MTKRRALLFIVCLSGSLLLSGCGGEETASSAEPRRFTTTFVSHMDTVVNFTAYCETSGEFDRASGIVSDTLAEADALYNRHSEESALSALNRAGGAFTDVPTALSDLLRSCQAWGAEAGGVHLALGKVIDLWQEAGRIPALPDADAICTALSHAKTASVEFSGELVRLTDPDAALDLGCVAKGAAADKAADRLLDAGFTTFLLDCGTSSIRCAGIPPGREGWTISLVNPDSRLNLSGTSSPAPTLGRLVLGDGSIGVSGDYQRYFTLDGEVYTHILDPNTGYPARFIRQVCVLTDSAARADFLSTALFAQPFETAWNTAQTLPGTESLFVLMDGSVRKTANFPLRSV